MKITRLKDHILLKTVSEISRKYIVKCNPKKPDKDPSSVKESYAVNVLLSLSNVVLCVDQLFYSIELLSNYRSSNTPEKMNRYDYIVYGIENYYLRLTSVYDRCLRLTNDIFRLGLPEKECKESTIIDNDYIKSTPVANALKDLNKFTQPFRFYRNTIAHKSSYSEHELNKLGTYYIVTEENEELTKYFHLYKNITDKYVANKKLEFKNNVDNLEALVNVLLDELYSFLLVKLDSYE